MERKLNEVFSYKNIVLKVEQCGNDLSCFGCYFKDVDDDYLCDPGIEVIQIIGNCWRGSRRDERQIIFKELKS